MKETGTRVNFFRRNTGNLVLAFLGLAATTSVAGSIPEVRREINSVRIAILSEETNFLQEKGLLGEHPIVDLKTTSNFNAGGIVAGNILFVIGGFQGRTTPMIQFGWKVKDSDDTVWISEIPLKNTKFIVNEDPTVKPTAEFTGINAKNLIDKKNVSVLDPEPLKKAVTNPTELENMNIFVNKVSDKMTIIRLSQQDYKHFREATSKLVMDNHR